MLKTFTALTPFIKFKSNKISIDNLAFKLHYRATFLLLLVCTLLVTSRWFSRFISDQKYYIRYRRASVYLSISLIVIVIQIKIIFFCTLRQYIGEHIRCITGGSVPEHVINTFCFFTTTFTVVNLIILVYDCFK